MSDNMRRFACVGYFQGLPRLRFTGVESVGISIEGVVKDSKGVKLIRKTVFPPPPKSSLREPRILAGMTHLSITRDHVYNALMAQSTQKALGLDKINFGILRMIWN